MAGLGIGLAITVLALGAHAATPDPWAPSPRPAAPPAGAPPPGAAPGAPAPYPGYPPGTPVPYPGYPPPGAAPPPQGWAPLAPYPAYPGYGGPAAQAMFAYDAQKKNEMLALAIEFFVPGVGSIYADHLAGALLTWATSVAGFALVVWAFQRRFQRDNSFNSGEVSSTQSDDTWAIYLGLGLLVGGRIYGFVDAYSSAKDFNRRLRTRLGLPDWAGVAVVPMQGERSLAWGPALNFRF